MKPPVIRPARPGDAGDLARNWIDTARHYAELDSDVFQVPADVSARLERPAEDAERQLLRDLGRARLYVDALGVGASYRRRGVGALLLRAAEAWGREQGMGYERRSIVFEKRLG